MKEEELISEGANTSPPSAERQDSWGMSFCQSFRQGAWIYPGLGLFSSFHCSLTVGTKQLQLNLDLFFKSNLLHVFVSPLILSWKLGWTVSFTQHVSVTYEGNSLLCP